MPRNDIETTTPCPVCQASFAPVRRQGYCSPACRQTAWRARTSSTELAALRAPARRGRRKHTVYACTQCEQRYLGQQWCDDCVRPCIRIGIGGLSANCDEPVVVDELLGLHNDDLTAASRENQASTQPGALYPARIMPGARRRSPANASLYGCVPVAAARSANSRASASDMDSTPSTAGVIFWRSMLLHPRSASPAWRLGLFSKPKISSKRGTFPRLQPGVAAPGQRAAATAGLGQYLPLHKNPNQLRSSMYLVSLQQLTDMELDHVDA